jgi:hypothetical protein
MAIIIAITVIIATGLFFVAVVNKDKDTFIERPVVYEISKDNDRNLRFV